MFRLMVICQMKLGHLCFDDRVEGKAAFFDQSLFLVVFKVDAESI